MLKKEYEVMVIGSGPAGAAAAKGLKDGGLEVLLVEKEKLPRYKVCSGFVFPRAQMFIEKTYGKIPEKLLCKEREGGEIKFFLSKDECIDVPLEDFGKGEGEVLENKILSTWRKDFDFWLAENSKAEIKDRCEFLDLDIKEDHLEVTLEYESKSIKARTKYLIGADGGNSKVRNALNPEFKNQIPWFFCYEEHYLGSIDLDPHCFYGFIDRRFSEFYMALYIKDDRIIFANGIRLGSKVEPFFKNFSDYLTKYHGFKPRERIHKGGCLLPGMSFSNQFYFGQDNVLLVGEAAGFLNLMGEGISSALFTGDIASRAIIKAEKDKQRAIDAYLPPIEKEKGITLQSLEKGKRLGF